MEQMKTCGSNAKSASDSVARVFYSLRHLLGVAQVANVGFQALIGNDPVNTRVIGKTLAPSTGADPVPPFDAARSIIVNRWRWVVSNLVASFQ